MVIFKTLAGMHPFTSTSRSEMNLMIFQSGYYLVIWNFFPEEIILKRFDSAKEDFLKDNYEITFDGNWKPNSFRKDSITSMGKIAINMLTQESGLKYITKTGATPSREGRAGLKCSDKRTEKGTCSKRRRTKTLFCDL